MMGRIDSYVVENIFRRTTYDKNHGFVKFDLAWGSDTASWISFCQNLPIITINGDCYVGWRYSELNITPKMSKGIAIRKFKSLIDFFCWSFRTFSKKRSIYLYNFIFLLKRFHFYGKALNESEIRRFSENQLCHYCSSYYLRYLYAISKLIVKL